jgi:Cell Wall Hydrolase
MPWGKVSQVAPPACLWRQLTHWLRIRSPGCQTKQSAGVDVALVTDAAFRQCLAAAAAVLADLVPDPTHGATHYHAPHVHPSWARGHAPERPSRRSRVKFRVKDLSRALVNPENHRHAARVLIGPGQYDG